jgi:hypothetical protein
VHHGLDWSAHEESPMEDYLEKESLGNFLEHNPVNFHDDQTTQFYIPIMWMYDHCLAGEQRSSWVKNSLNVAFCCLNYHCPQLRKDIA